VVKWSHGFHSATTMMPDRALEEIRIAVTDGLDRMDQLRPYRLEGPIDLEVGFKNYLQAQVLAYLPLAELVDAHTVRYRAPDMLHVSRFLQFINNYRPGLTP
jgi:D-amino peptidase